MATRRYIGARYVPKFYQNSVDGSAQWEANVVYEPLTYVTLTNGHMYLSRKQVPATVGSPVSNIDYWLDVANYNGYISQLQAEIDTINNVTIPAVQSDVALKQDITDNNLNTTDKTVVGAINELVNGKQDKADNSLDTTDKTVVGAINELVNGKQDKTDNNLDTTDKTVVGAINELNSDVEDLANKINSTKKLTEKKYVLVGDSYAASYDTLGCSWLRDFVNNYDIPTTNYYDATYSGTGFTTNRTFKNNVENIMTSITEPNSITDVVVLGGINDVLYGNITNLGSGISEFCTYCKTQFPNANIHIGFVGNIINAHTEDMYNAINTFIDYSKTNAVNYLHNIEFVLRNKGNMNLTHLVGGLAFHPNHSGTTAIAEHLAECLLNGYADVRYRGTNQLNVDYTLISAIDNNDVKLWYRGHLFSGLDATLANRSALTVDTFRAGALLDGCNEGETKVLSATVTCLVSYDQNNTGTNVQTYVPLNIVFENGRMDVYLGAETVSMNHVKAISIPRFTLSWFTTSI